MLKIAYHPIYKHPLPEGHKFPMAKYELLPRKLIDEGTCNRANFFEPGVVAEKHILAVHDKKYYEDLLAMRIEGIAARRIGFPLSDELILREKIIADGTVKACEFALRHGVAMNIAGGTHHAYSNRAEAFCLLNDQAIAARYLLKKGKAKQILIIDLDVHQGNGTAEIFSDDSRVFTFSMHGAGNYPFQKEKSDLDIALKKGTSDHEYLSLLEEQLEVLINGLEPDFIFYLCGVDIIETDKLGTLAVSKEGCRLRDEMVLTSCHRHEIPVQCSMGGGYSKDIEIIVDAHANTFRLAKQIWC
ncbi:MAG: histone deacetylase [Flavobacteriaceae bacterium]